MAMRLMLFRSAPVSFPSRCDVRSFCGFAKRLLVELACIMLCVLHIRLDLLIRRPIQRLPDAPSRGVACNRGMCVKYYAVLVTTLHISWTTVLGKARRKSGCVLHSVQVFQPGMLWAQKYREQVQRRITNTRTASTMTSDHTAFVFGPKQSPPITAIVEDAGVINCS